VLQKIVISRKQEMAYDNFNPFNALLKLMTTYDHSFVYLWHHPKVGSWLGATPEVLLQSSGDIIKTMALAGTLPVKPNVPVTWRPKEIKEQQFVTDEIVSKLKKYSQDITVSLPRTIFQGHLAHIRTDISASIPMKQLSNLVFDIHPTPAVCGLVYINIIFFNNFTKCLYSYW
jgi:isochorismate synthase